MHSELGSDGVLGQWLGMSMPSGISCLSTRLRSFWAVSLELLTTTASLMLVVLCCRNQECVCSQSLGFCLPGEMQGIKSGPRWSKGSFSSKRSWLLVFVTRFKLSIQAIASCVALRRLFHILAFPISLCFALFVCRVGKQICEADDSEKAKDY